MQAGTIRDFTGGNPVSIAEFRYQRFVIERGRVGGLWILLAALLMIPALLSALVLSLGMLVADPLLPVMIQTLQGFDAGTQQFLQGAGNLGMTALLIGNLALYPVVTLITLGLSANSIRREKQGYTWDTLRLTEMGAWRIVTGKWRASLRALNGDHGMMTLLRCGLLAAVMLFHYGAVQSGITPELPALSVSYGLATLVLLVLCIVYGMLDGALSAALGIPGTIPNEATGTVMGGLATSLRIAASIAAVAWMVLSLQQLVYEGLLPVLVMAAIGIPAYLLAILGALLLARWLVK